MRCIKPNSAQVPDRFDAPLVLHQLRCCGVLEVTRIARAGYPTRYAHSAFAERYRVLLHGRKGGLWDARHPCYAHRVLSVAGAAWPQRWDVCYFRGSQDPAIQALLRI